MPWFARSRFLVLICYLLTGLVPFFIPNRAPEAIILIWALATLPQTLVTVGFAVVMGGVAGPAGCFTLMSRRWAILGLTNSLTVLIVGQVLKLYQFPLNYQVVFIGSAAGALISVVFSSSIKLPPQAIVASRRGSPQRHPEVALRMVPGFWREAKSSSLRRATASAQCAT